MKRNRLLYLGDIHGNFSLIGQYVKIYGIKNANLIQVGDFGVGFNFIKEKRSLSLINEILIKNNVVLYAIRGNHDFKDFFDNDPFDLSNIKLVSDYTVLNFDLGTSDSVNVLFMGGAVSVDRSWRKTNKQSKGDMTIYPGQRWWDDEVFILDREKLLKIKDIDIVVSHTSPDYCYPDNSNGFGYFVENIIKDTGDTNLRTDLMFERNQMTEAFFILRENGNNIKNHYYGHFHSKQSGRMFNTDYRLLDVGELWEER